MPILCNPSHSTKHNFILSYNIKTTITIFSLSLLLIGCGDSTTNTRNTVNTPTSTRFSKLTMVNQNILRDTNTGLEWVEGNNVAGVSSGCSPQPAGQTEAEIKNIAEQFCQDLDFASHGDWRMATATEHQEFITRMEAEGKVPFYANPACPRLVAEETNGTISTVNTHNTAPTGTILPWSNQNAGIKCVRTF